LVKWSNSKFLLVFFSGHNLALPKQNKILLNLGIGVTLEDVISCPDVEGAAHPQVCGKLGEDGCTWDLASFPLTIPQDCNL
jgi:hypothetical protein